MDGDLLSEVGKLQVHPFADLFPMLPDDELADLAADIQENGLLHPLMLDHTGKVLIDGRNRLRACQMARIQPHFEQLPRGIEPADYIASVNLARRHLSVGQRAMALAMLYPDARRGRHSQLGQLTGKVSKERLSKARAVLRVAPDELAPLVLSGAKSLDDAFAEVRRREQSALSDDAKLVRLRTEAPDLADMVVEGTLTLPEALAALEQRARDKRIAIEQGHRAAAEIIAHFEAHVGAIVGAIELGEPIKLSRDQLKRLIAAQQLLAERGAQP